MATVRKVLLRDSAAEIPAGPAPGGVVSKLQRDILTTYRTYDESIKHGRSGGLHGTWLQDCEEWYKSGRASCFSSAYKTTSLAESVRQQSHA
jgi:hypothetical protein